MNVNSIITGKDVVANFSSGGTTAFSTLSRIKVENRSEKTGAAASNLSGGKDRTAGTRYISGYMWDYGDCPPTNGSTSEPLFVNDPFDLAFTLDGANAVQIADSGYGVRCTGLEIVAMPSDEGDESYVYYVLHFGPTAADLTKTTSIPTDGTAPALLSTKSLGVKFAYWVPTGETYSGTTGPALKWVEPCYFAGMHAKIVAEADPAVASCLGGLAYTPPGTIDWVVQLGQKTNRFPIPVSPNAGIPYMLTGQPAPSNPTTSPGSVNSDLDLVYPDLDAVVGIQVATRLNADYTFNAYWQFLYGILSQKGGEFSHKSRKPLAVQYVFEKCGSPVSRTNDTGYSAGSISYVSGVDSNGSGGTTIQLWP